MRLGQLQQQVAHLFAEVTRTAPAHSFVGQPKRKPASCKQPAVLPNRTSARRGITCCAMLCAALAQTHLLTPVNARGRAANLWLCAPVGRMHWQRPVDKARSCVASQQHHTQGRCQQGMPFGNTQSETDTCSACWQSHKTKGFTKTLPQCDLPTQTWPGTHLHLPAAARAYAR